MNVPKLLVSQLEVERVDFRNEIIGGTVNALLLAYALILNPTIVAATGMPFGALMTTTILLTIIFTLANGLYGRVPFAQSVYMGENAFFAFALVVYGGIPWQTALGIVFWAGILFFLVTVTGVRKRLATAIPRELGLIWGAAVAFFLLYLAFFDGGAFKASTQGLPTVPGDYRATATLAFFGLLIITAILYTRIKGAAMFLSIIVALLVGPFILGLALPELRLGIVDPSPILMQIGFAEAWAFPHLIIAFLLIEMVDVTGTLKALVTPMKLKNEEEVIERVMRVEGVSTAVGAMFGQPTVGTYIESGGAVAAGARTGLANVVTALIFLVPLFMTPFFEKLPFWFLLWATAPALAVVAGYILINVLQEIDFKKDPAYVLLFLTIMPGVLAGNLLLAFALPMTSLAGIEWFSKRRVTRGNLALLALGLVLLALYHY